MAGPSEIQGVRGYPLPYEPESYGETKILGMSSKNLGNTTSMDDITVTDDIKVSHIHRDDITVSHLHCGTVHSRFCW
jgi:hypothetical protein